MTMDLHIVRKILIGGIPFDGTIGRIDYTRDGRICTGLCDRPCVSSLSHLGRKSD